MATFSPESYRSYISCSGHSPDLCDVLLALCTLGIRGVLPIIGKIVVPQVSNDNECTPSGLPQTSDPFCFPSCCCNYLELPLENGLCLLNLVLFLQGVAPDDKGIQAASTPYIEILRELVGNQGEITDLRFIGPPARPSHLAVATNSSIIRLYSMASKACEAAIHGHTDMVLALDSIQTGQGHSILVSGSKDCSFRLWKIQARLYLNIA